MMNMEQLINWIKQVLEDPELEPIFEDWLEDQGFERKSWGEMIGNYKPLKSCATERGCFWMKGAYKKGRNSNLVEEPYHLSNHKYMDTVHADEADSDLYYYPTPAHAYADLLIALNAYTTTT